MLTVSIRLVRLPQNFKLSTDHHKRINFIHCYMLLILRTMERDYKAVQIFDKFYVSLQTYSNYHSKWVEGLFKDMNGDDLEFIRKIDAENWIETRQGVMNA